MNRNGSVTLVEPKVRCLAGTVVGGGTVFIGMTERGLHGYLQAGGELYLLSSGEGIPGRAMLTHASQLGAPSYPGRSQSGPVVGKAVPQS